MFQRQINVHQYKATYIPNITANVRYSFLYECKVRYMREKKLCSDGGDYGSKKCKLSYGGAYGEIWCGLRLAGVWNQAVSFVLVG
jgi:hypothetical protein